ncbi:MAG: IS1634 family transposase [Desulfobacteraceae bacterium]|nr:IS1634 family transposase [Desulfobacteraceae bacterium]
MKRITKPDRKGEKIYEYYRLVHSYKIGKKIRQQTVINLGSLDKLPKEKHKLLADRIEELLTGSESLFFDIPNDVEELARKFTKKIIEKGVYPVKKRKMPISKELETDFQEIDMNSIDQLESKTIGGEWLVNQAFNKFGLSNLFSDIGMSENEAGIAQMLLTAKMLHPSSELEAERWLHENSGVGEIYNPFDNHSVSRYRLYKAATHMYKYKDEIEKTMYSTTCSLFSQKSKIVIYDLTNMYFEGQMLGSKKAKFGRSKQKRNDRRLIGLALAIDNLGFVRYSKIYKGNIGEPGTFEAMLDDVASQLYSSKEKPVVVMDAGISTEENLECIKQREYDYVCVSRSKPKEYTKLSEQATKLLDNRNNTIEVTKISVPEKKDIFLYIKSHQKQLKEQSMNDKITERFTESMTYLKEGLNVPRRLKKIIPVHEKVGRIKKQYSKVAKLYKISYKEDLENGVVTNIIWELQKESPKGEYFLRYSKENLSEKEIWDTYNMTRDVEATFRCLKTDLDIRPIFHQKDAYIEPHIWLGIVAYQIVNYIKLKLKDAKINYSWTTIVEKMQSQQYSVQSADRRGGGKIYTKLCTQPGSDLKAIYSALGFKYRPFVRKSKVVTQQ